MKGLLRMFTQGDRCTLLAGASGKHVEKFGHFKEFLGGNRNGLRALAELEMLYYSGQSFTAADIAQETGLSRITIRKYMELMRESGMLETELEYGEVGRPQKRYSYTEKKQDA